MLPSDYEVVFLEEDATEMRDIPDNSIDLIWASPPYWKAERLKSDHPHELAKTETYDEFLELYAKTFKQMDRFVVIQVGDVRFDKTFYPLHADTIELAKEAGLQLHDIVILMNFSIFATATGARSEKMRYTIKTHEYLLVFKR
jgi:DNA modification methylase